MVNESHATKKGYMQQIETLKDPFASESMSYEYIKTDHYDQRGTGKRQNLSPQLQKGDRNNE